MSNYRNRTPSPVRSIRAPPPSTPRRSRHNGLRYRDSDRGRGYDLPPRRRSKSYSRSRSHSPATPRRHNGAVTLLLCVFHSSSHNWSTAPVKLQPTRTNDKDLWFDIRETYQVDLRKPWTRWFSFRHVSGILPVTFSANGIPNKADVGADFPSARALRHMYHHPEQVRTKHAWVDVFTDLDAQSKGQQAGLQFVEGLNADKLGVVAIAATVAIVVVSIVWCVKGGNLQTVFTVMGFVLTLVAAQIALVALYFQIVGNDSSGSGSS